MNNKYKSEKEKFDDSFKDVFGDFQAPPSKMNWNKISSQLEGETFDVAAKNKLSKLEVTPEPHIWENVRKKLPLSLFVRNQLDWLSAVAAALTIFMVVMLALDKNNTSTESIIVADSTTTDVEKIINEEPEQDFVYAIEETDTEPEEESISEVMSEEDEEAVADFWDDFLNEDEDIIANADEELVEESLKPIDQLPIENLEAALSIPVKEPQQILVGKSNQNVLETILQEKIISKK